MFGIGLPELVVILVVALLVFGPNRLPEIARSLGKGLAEFRRASNELRQSFNEASQDRPEERGGPTAAERAKALAAKGSEPAPGPAPGEAAAPAGAAAPAAGAPAGGPPPGENRIG